MADAVSAAGGGGGLGIAGGALGILGAAGQIVTSGNTLSSIESATQTQAQAQQSIYNNILNQLSPDQINQIAQTGSLQYAQGGLALQRLIDPSLYGAQFSSSQDLAAQLASAASPTSPLNTVSNAAVQQALSVVPGLQQNATALTSQANNLLAQGAALPSSVQAQAVEQGLEQGAQVTGGMPNPGGVTGTILKQILGTAGYNLQQQRQQQASGLLQSAQNINNTQQSMLTNLFPSLTQTQLQALTGQQTALATSNEQMPTSGLSGSDIANLWLSQLGGLSQSKQNLAQIQATGKLAATAANNQTIGAYTNLASSIASLGMGI